MSRDGRQTRARIASEAIRLFAERGYERTSMKDVAQAVGVTEPAVYRHFPSREALGRELFQAHYASLAQEIAALLAADGRPFDRRLEAAVVRLADLHDRDPALFSFLLMNQHRFVADLSDRPDENVVEALVAAFDAARARAEIDIEDPVVAAAVFLGIVSQLATFALYGRLAGPMRPRAADAARRIHGALERKA